MGRHLPVLHGSRRNMAEMDPAYETSVLRDLRSEGALALADQFEVARYLSKLGCLDSDEERLRFIAPLLTQAEVLALHAYLTGFRAEFAWREQFERIFCSPRWCIARTRPVNGRKKHARPLWLRACAACRFRRRV
jgi:hypothetical protein